MLKCHYYRNAAYIFILLPRDAVYSADYAVARCLSVRLTVTRRYCVKTAKCVIKLFAVGQPHHFSLFPRQTL